MKVEVTSRKVFGSIKVPSSKSSAHRALICASLAKNQKSIITNLDISDDINATINALSSLGASIKLEGNKAIVIGTNMEIREKFEFDANESGSTLRFLIPLCANLAKRSIIKGSSKLLSRPLSVYKDIMQDGLKVNDKYLELDYEFKAQKYVISGDISSQFISGLLFLLPLLDKDSVIEIKKPYESKSYVDLTIDMLKKYGIEIESNDNIIYIKGNQEYKPFDYEVEGDYSQAAFFLVLGVLNNDLTLIGLNELSLQGDKEIINILERMGAKIIKENNSVSITKSNLKGIEIDLANCPDLGPILMAVAPFCEGVTHLTNVKRLRLKESDRIKAMSQELKKFNVKVKEEENDVYISKTNIKVIDNHIYSHNDHRIAMSMAVLATALENEKIVLEQAECINKSYPNFYFDLNSINGSVVELDD